MLLKTALFLETPWGPTTSMIRRAAARGASEFVFLSLLVALVPSVAHAQRSATQDALSRMEETIEARKEDGVLATDALQPLVVVSVASAFEETRAWYPTAALAALIHVFGAATIRSCEACNAPRTHVSEGRLEQNVAALSIQEIIRLDEGSRGTAPPARTAIWLDETMGGVSLRVVDLGSSRVIYAENFDHNLREATRTTENFTLTRELERRARGDALSHVFLDASLYPGQHISMDWAEQWGDSNRNISGVTLSVVDPLIGVGGSYYRIIPEALNLTVGGQVLVSLPTALVSAVSGDVTEVIDPLLTGVVVVRLPIATSNYAVLLTASTNLTVGIGISLLNISLFPVLL